MISATPVVKWVGGKRKLAPRLATYAPPNMDFYAELFCGGSALFFHLRAQGYDGPVLLNDINPELVSVYRAIQTQPEDLIRALRLHRNESDYFYSVRSQPTDRMSTVDRASRMIFLNKTCFNGLWRENKSGGMNSPFGKYEKPTICDADNILAASVALRNTQIENRPFNAHWPALASRPKAFLYYDPPYIPVSITANFTSYAKSGFGEADQRQLSEIAGSYSKRGFRVVISNSDTPMTRLIFSDFEAEEVQMARNINSAGAKRGKIGELILSAGR